ncbi:L,D-transpeptidase [Jannaschia ovalis]|uniref:L,D-transpeptidase n=1 Tax=Jannaschia ovalis TaxID=3038773 RepID=A0ABY8LHC8_9RHOB|nr:L,D-transpeptidase [Jannaschia sp. GRR-S6-38]WGH79589.1 L,D-transpeptidase [Jannaschia sp. GRR-S6-38]
MQRRDLIAGAAASGLLAGLPQSALARISGPELQPVRVRIRPDIAPGEVHVIPDAFMLYWTMPGAQAIRYMVRVGRDDLYEPGEYFVGAKKEWPSWTPTQAMIERNPAYAEWEDGQPGGPENPLGARALYLFQPGRGDTFLRIHGTNAPSTIGSAVSNGCAGLLNDHVIDLYNRVPMRSRVVLHPKTV